MSEVQDRAEIDDDRTSLLGPDGMGRAAALSERTWSRLPWAVLATLAILLGALTIDLDGEPSQATASVAPSNPAAFTRTGGLPFPTGLETACSLLGGVEVSAAPGVYEPRTRPRLDANGVAVYVARQEAGRGDIVRAVSDLPRGGRSTSTVRRATFSTRGSTAGSADITGWDESRNEVLVRTSITDVGDTQPWPRCSGLYFVAVDNGRVSRLTSEFGAEISAVALAPRTGKVAYAALDGIWVASTSAPPRLLTACSGVSWLAWSDDEDAVLASCQGEDLVIVSDSRESPMRIPIPAGGRPIAASSSGQRATLVAAPEEGVVGPLTVYDVDLEAGTLAPRVRSSMPAAWFGAFGPPSPSGRWLFAGGSFEPPALDSLVVDLLSGQTTPLRELGFGTPVTWSSDEASASWFSGGTLVRTDLTTMTQVDIGQLVDADSAIWLPHE
jgi:hypothetical protein